MKLSEELHDAYANPVDIFVGNLLDWSVKAEELEQQINKMKCCENCKHYHYQYKAKECVIDEETYCDTLSFPNWEMIE